MRDIIKRIADLIGEGGTLAPDSMSGQLLNECANEIVSLERQRDEARAQLAKAREAFCEIIEECNNSGAPNPIVMDRMIERIEKTSVIARYAIDAAISPSPKGEE
jgi:hypothetical protein